MHHALLSSPLLDPDAPRTTNAPWGYWALTATPLQLLWAGDEAVVVFFVLSGFVLSLPPVPSQLRAWAAYYPRRLLRLYGPLVLATLLSWAVVVAWPRTPTPGAGPWLAFHERPYTAGTVAHDAFLLAGTGSLNSPLWSLRWEVVFSLLLPLYLALLRRGPVIVRWSIVWACLFAALVVPPRVHALGLPVSDALRFLPLFAFGVLLATDSAVRDRLTEVAARGWVLRSQVLLWAGGFALLGPKLGERFDWAPVIRLVLHLAQPSGAVFLVVWCLAGPVTGGLSTSRTIQWLGSRSFSLYLTHEPIVVTIAHLRPPSDDPLPVLLLSLPLCLLVTEIFHRLGERPAIELSRRVGRRISGIQAPGRRVTQSAMCTGSASAVSQPVRSVDEIDRSLGHILARERRRWSRGSAPAIAPVEPQGHVARRGAAPWVRAGSRGRRAARG